MKNSGPCFGLFELHVKIAPFNSPYACRSHTTFNPIYKIPENSEGINMLTNKKGLDFTISSIEVWGVMFKD
jgi:hypothetical protein